MTSKVFPLLRSTWPGVSQPSPRRYHAFNCLLSFCRSWHLMESKWYGYRSNYLKMIQDHLYDDGPWSLAPVSIYEETIRKLQRTCSYYWITKMILGVTGLIHCWSTLWKRSACKDTECQKLVIGKVGHAHTYYYQLVQYWNINFEHRSNYDTECLWRYLPYNEQPNKCTRGFRPVLN